MTSRSSKADDPHDSPTSPLSRGQAWGKSEDRPFPIKSGTGSKKIPEQDFRDAEDDMSVGNLPEHVGTEPFPEFHHPLLMAGGAEMTALAGEGQKKKITEFREEPLL